MNINVRLGRDGTLRRATLHRNYTSPISREGEAWQGIGDSFLGGVAPTNLATRGIDFADAIRLDWSTSDTTPDNRRDYGEARFRTFGLIGNRLHVMVWTPRPGKFRIISLRKANERERKQWARRET